MRTLIIIPAYNEVKNVPTLINNITKNWYDYIVINDVLEDCVETVDRIIKNEHNRTSDRMPLIEDIRNDLLKNAWIGLRKGDYLYDTSIILRTYECN